ncbi:response regulator [Dyadobacter sp. CY356]|uniref:response regulator n=1 Tax=Dyadobacter sp. CY356 TaxID=2906442 RepID=UPI001F476B6D|nr:response regulator [Dyadobacter sp. CY356]MCF0055217.1 response regulator [Dyadobacter sp. CY356]
MTDSEQIIFLVDDDEDDRMLIGEAIVEMMHNVRVIEFNNGIDFLDSILAQPHLKQPLILMDINMPRMSGLEVISAMQSDPQCRLYPVVAISTAQDAAQIEKVIASGALQYYTKPHSFDQIGQLVGNIKDFYYSHYGF